MSSRIRFLFLALSLAGTAHAEDGIASDMGTWALWLLGLLAIGIYAAVQMHRD